MTDAHTAVGSYYGDAYVFWNTEFNPKYNDQNSWFRGIAVATFDTTALPANAIVSSATVNISTSQQTQFGYYCSFYGDYFPGGYPQPYAVWFNGNGYTPTANAFTDLSPGPYMKLNYTYGIGIFPLINVGNIVKGGTTNIRMWSKCEGTEPVTFNINYT